MTTSTRSTNTSLAESTPYEPPLAPDRRRSAAGVEKDVPFEAWVVGLSARAGAGCARPDSLALGDREPRRPPQHRRGHAGLCSAIPLLLSPPRHLLRLRRRLLQSLSR